MNALLKRIESTQATHRIDRLARYAALLRDGDAADAGELSALMRDLGLSADDVRRHAVALDTATRLRDAAGRREELAAAAVGSRQALSDLKEENKRRRLELDQLERDAHRQVAADGQAAEEARAAETELRELRWTLPFLFAGDVADAPPAAAAVPERIDPRLLSIDPAGVFTVGELADGYGLPAADLGAAGLPAVPGGGYLGRTVRAWAVQAAAALRASRRAELEAMIVPVDSRLDGLSPEKLYSLDVLSRDHGLPRDRFRLRQESVPVYGADQYRGQDLREWAAYASGRNAAARAELAALDAADRPDPPPAEPAALEVPPPRPRPDRRRHPANANDLDC